MYLLVALAVGTLLPLQVGVNAELSRWLGDPVRAAFVSFLVGTIALLVVAAFVRKPVPSLARLGDVPWWVWTGGLIGAGQAIGSVAIDQYGWVGFREQHVSLGRAVGMALVIGGVALVRFF